MKPEKILGKKFVRGKPYYKIKWHGSGKDQATWETPPALEKYKPMINNYEMRNWGVPLDEKFFDEAIYVNKGFAHRSKTLNDKKQAKKSKMKEKKKIEEVSQSSESSEFESSSSSEEEIKPRKTRRQEKMKENASIRKKKDIDSKPKPPIQYHEVMIIDSDSELEANPAKKKATSQIPPATTKQKDLSHFQPPPEQEVNPNEAGSSSSEQSESQDNSPVSASGKDIGLNLQPQLPSSSNNIPQKSRKQLQMSNMVQVYIQPTHFQKKVVQLYHLQKLSIGNHLYLVEYEDNQMAKLTTSQLTQWHPDQLMVFLERKLKCRGKE